MAAAIRVLAVCGHRGARVGRPFRSYRQASVRTRAAGARVRVRNRTTAKFSGLAPNTRSQFNFQPKPVIRPRQPARPAGPKSPRTSLVRGRCRGLSGQAAGRRPVGRGPQGQTGSGKAVDPSHGEPVPRINGPAGPCRRPHPSERGRRFSSRAQAAAGPAIWAVRWSVLRPACPPLLRVGRPAGEPPSRLAPLSPLAARGRSR